MAAVASFGLAGAASIAIPSPMLGQMHKVAKPEEVVRAVGVYEWLGDEAKPTASRLIPVTLFIDGELQDAGVYLARPVPFAIDSGTLYEVDQAGVAKGTLDVKYASHLQATDLSTNYDDGWFGYGTFAPPPAAKKTVALKESKRPAKIESSRADQDPDRPTLTRRHESTADEASASNSNSGTASGTGSGASDSKTDSTSANASTPPPDDPDRPHLTRRSSDASSTAPTTAPTTASTTSTQTTDTGAAASSQPSQTAADNPPASASPGSAPAGDPDRPTLKKRTPEQAKKARKEAEDSSATGLATSLNDDPNRPTLHRGKGQQALTEADLPKLKGVPVGLHQAVVVSDAKTRPVHDFARPWQDDAERAGILAKMETLARAQIAAYQRTTPAPAVPAPAAKKATAPSPNSKLRRATKKDTATQPPVPLEEEQLKGYTLSYGGSPTYVYTAHTPGDGADLRYVTVVAQVDAFGELKPAIQSVTDAAHLDRTPWMRPIDVVDVDASNRASLLFEMRGQSARQFAVYRVIAGHSEQTFLSGTTQ